MSSETRFQPLIGKDRDAVIVWSRWHLASLVAALLSAVALAFVAIPSGWIRVAQARKHEQRESFLCDEDLQAHDLWQARWLASSLRATWTRNFLFAAAELSSGAPLRRFSPLQEQIR